MKLGIVVAYMLKEQDEQLLDLHLRMIERYTSVLYTIYAGVSRLPERFRAKLVGHPRARICGCPSTTLRGGLEHAFYLEHLIGTAVEEGASHIAVLHVDSFPISPGWAEELAAKISGRCALATVEKNGLLVRYTACLFFPREFYLAQQPRLLLNDADRRTSVYQRYCREIPHNQKESGAGYCFRAHQAGLTWHALREMIPDPGNELRGNIYGGLIFHLDGAFRAGHGTAKARAAAPVQSRADLGQTDITAAGPPRGTRARSFLAACLRRCLPGLYRHFLRRPALERGKQAFLDDPESYIAWLQAQTGRERPND